MSYTYDSATKDSTGAFLVGELERLDPTLNLPLADVTWQRDILLREDVTMADEASSFTRTDFAAMGGLGAGGKSWLGKNSTAVQGINVDIAKIANPLVLWGQEVSYTLPELESAIKMGRPIDTQKIAGLNLKFQMDIDEQVYVGDKQLGVKGMFNSDTLIVPVNVVNGVGGTPQWSTKTPLEILKDIQECEQAAYAATGYSLAPTELRVSPTQFMQLLQPLTIGGTSYNSILAYAQENAVCMAKHGVKLNIQGVKWLATAGVGLTSRMVAYRNEYDRVRFPLVPLQRTAVTNVGITQAVTYFGKLGVTEIVYAECFSYRDLL